MSNIKLFNDKAIRTHWNVEKEEWLFSVVDVCGIFSESQTPRNYWSNLKRKLIKEGSQLHSKIVRLKLQAGDGKSYLTDVLNTEGIFRLLQSVPSKKAEPFKAWLAQVGRERVDEISDPEIAFQRAADTYLKKGYSNEWVNQRILSIELRKELTDEWKEKGIREDKEYAILTDEITKAWSDKTVKEYKRHKSLTKGNLRDNMTNLEIVLNMLAEVSTTEISRDENPANFGESLNVAKRGGAVAKTARTEIEKQLGRSVISKSNASDKPALDESPQSLGLNATKIFESKSED